MKLRVILLLVFVTFSESLGFNDTESFTIFPPPEKTLCEREIELLEEGQKPLNREGWAIKMEDSRSKHPLPGHFDSNIRDYGAYTECMDIKYNGGDLQFVGKHCTYGAIVAHWNPIPWEDRNTEKSVQRLRTMLSQEFYTEKELKNLKVLDYGTPNVELMSLCIPSDCEPKDMRQYLKDKYPGVVVYSNLMCQTSEDKIEYDAYDITTLSIYGIFICLVGLSTIYDHHLTKINKEPKHSLLISFSAIRNVRILTKTRKTRKDKIQCLEGMRTFSCLWVVVFSYISMAVVPMINLRDLLEYAEVGWIPAMLLGGALGADSFFFISGCLLSYHFIRKSKKGFKFNIFYFYIHRILRILPTMTIFFFYHISISRRLNTGPYFPFITNWQRETCLDNWWSFFLFVQNYVNPKELCIPRTWWLSVDMQLFILSPLLLLPLLKWPRATMGALWLLILGSIAAPFGIVYKNEVNILFPHFLSHYYYFTHNRAAPWLVGIFCGIILHKYERFNINKYLNAIFITLAYAICFLIITLYDNFLIHMDQLEVSFYLALSKPVWGLCLTYITFACVKGRGGVVNWFLSLRFWQIYGKLTFAVYLLHGAMAQHHVGQMKVHIAFSVYDVFIVASIFIFLATLVAIVWVVVLEFPIANVERILIGGLFKQYPEKHTEDEHISSTSLELSKKQDDVYDDIKQRYQIHV